MLAKVVSIQVNGTWGPEMNPRFTPKVAKVSQRDRHSLIKKWCWIPREKRTLSICFHPLHRASQDSKAWSIKDTHKPDCIKIQSILFEERCWHSETTPTLRGSLLLSRLRFSWEVFAAQAGVPHSAVTVGKWGAAGTPQGPWLTSLNLQGQQSVLFLHVSQEQLEKWIRNKIPLLNSCKITTYPGISLRKCRIFM